MTITVNTVADRSGMKNPISQNKKMLGRVIFLLYMVALVYFCFFSEHFGRTAHVYGEYRYNLVPFREIARYIRFRDTIGYYIVVINLIGNILAFIPFGFFWPIIGIRKYAFARTVISGFLTSLLIEISQLLVFVGSFDVDDLILNTLGSVIGYLLFRLVYRWWAFVVRRQMQVKSE